MGETAKQRSDGEEDEGHYKANWSSENVADGSNKGHGDCIGQEVGRPDPEPLCSVAAEVGHDSL